MSEHREDHNDRHGYKGPDEIDVRVLARGGSPGPGKFLNSDGVWEDPAATGPGAGAPTTADYLVGSAQAGLSSEIVVGPTPGGELGGTWAAPTVDNLHAGSTHLSVQQAAEATAANNMNAHLVDPIDAHDASAISVIPDPPGLTSTDVQHALEELATTIVVGPADRGIEIVNSLPPLPDARYPQGIVVFLTTDNKLYRSTGTAWTVAVPTADLTGKITAPQVGFTVGGGNGLLNSSFEDQSGVFNHWSVDDTVTTWVGDTSTFRYGTRSARMTVIDGAFSGNPDHYARAHQTLLCTGYEGPWTLSAWIKGPAGRQIGVSMWRAYDIGGVPTYTWTPGFPADGNIGAGITVVATGVWQRVILNIPADTSTATTMQFDIRAGADGTWTAGQQMWVDAVQAEPSEVATAYAPKPDEILPLTIGSTELADLAVLSQKLADNAVVVAKIADGAVARAKIVDDAIDATKLADGSVFTDAIQPSAIISAKIAASEIKAVNIAAGAVVAGKIDTDAVVAGNIAAGAVQAGDIAAGAVVAGSIAAGSVTTEKLTVASVSESVLLNPGFEELQTPPGETTMAAHWIRGIGTPAQVFVNTAPSGGSQSGQNVLHLQPGAGGQAMVASDTVAVAPGEQWYMAAWVRSNTPAPGFYFRASGGANPTDHTDISGSFIENGSLTTTWTKYATTITVPSGYKWLGVAFYNWVQNTGNAVSVDSVELRKVVVSAQIADGAIVADKIQTGAVIAGKIGADAVQAGNIQAGAVQAGDIEAGAIHANDIAAGQITTNHIVAGTIQAANIASNTITANEIASNAIQAAELSAINLEVGKYLRSQIYTPGSVGWSIDAAGNAEFGNALVRGTVDSSYLKTSVITGVVGANLITNPGAETNVSGWGLVANTAIARDTAVKRSGAASFKLTATADATIGFFMGSLPCQPGVAYSLTAFVKGATAAAAGNTVQVEIQAWDAANNFLQNWYTQGPKIGSTVWRSLQISTRAAIPANAAYLTAVVYMLSALNGQALNVDDVVLQPISSMYASVETGPPGSPTVQAFSDAYPHVVLGLGIDGESGGHLYRMVETSAGLLDYTGTVLTSGFMPGQVSGDDSSIQIDAKALNSIRQRTIRLNTSRAYVSDGGAGDVALAVHTGVARTTWGSTQTSNTGAYQQIPASNTVTFRKRHIDTQLLFRISLVNLFVGTGPVSARFFLGVGGGPSVVDVTQVQVVAGTPRDPSGEAVVANLAAGTYTFSVQWKTSDTAYWMSVDPNSLLTLSVTEVSA